MPRHLLPLTLLATMAGPTVSCRPRDRVEITQSRPRHTSEAAPRLDVPLADSLPSSEGYRWALPDGWVEQPPNQFRDANFSFGPGGEGECYISRSQGSEIDNVNRWRQQMAQPPLTAEELAALPRRTLFGFPSVFVDLTGTYSGAAGASPQADSRLVGLVRAESDLTLTIKMTGPSHVIDTQIANFDSFVGSLKLTPSYSQ